MHHWVPMPLLAGAYLWHMLVMPLTWVGIVLTRPFVRKADIEERRGFFVTCGVATPPLLTLACAAWAVRRMDDLRVRSFRLAIKNLPPALHGLRIAHVSDLHVGKFTSPTLLNRAVDAVTEIDPDLVLMPGDLIDLSLSDLPRAIETVRRLCSRHGVFLCEGNHDRIEDGDEFVHRVKAEGLNLLIDEGRTVTIKGARVQLLGLSWQRGARANKEAMARVRAARDPRAFPILMAHHPHAFDLHCDLPLTLAGHTHGGQMMFNEKTGPGAWLYRYWSGLYERKSQKLVVSNGVGNCYPLRVQAPAEIVVVELTSG